MVCDVLDKNVYLDLIDYYKVLLLVCLFEYSYFIISQYYYELPKRTIRANGNASHIFKPNNFRDIQNPYQDKASTDMTLNEFKYLTSACWNEKYQPLTIDKTEDQYQGR